LKLWRFDALSLSHKPYPLLTLHHMRTCGRCSPKRLKNEHCDDTIQIKQNKPQSSPNTQTNPERKKKKKGVKAVKASTLLQLRAPPVTIPSHVRTSPLDPPSAISHPPLYCTHPKPLSPPSNKQCTSLFCLLKAKRRGLRGGFCVRFPLIKYIHISFPQFQ
jgi:hypothetical protein